MEHLTNWIEIPVTDLKRAMNFYAAMLGIELQEIEIDPVTYALFPSRDRFNCGTLAYGEYFTPSQDEVTIYLNGGNDLNAILSRVRAAGGKVIMEKILLSPQAGYIGMFIDTEGNKIGLQNA